MLPVGISCGDPAGVGLEIIRSWLLEHPEQQDAVVPVGPREWLETLPVPGIPVGRRDFKVKPGQPEIEGAQLAMEAMEVVAEGCKQGRFSSVVTGPISKYHCKQAGFSFPGQTEFFESKWGGEASMAFVGDSLKVVLATWHIPLREVIPSLVRNPALIKTAASRAALLANLCGVEQPRIGVCGLNPHAGEGGEIGTEEVEFLNPLLEKLKKEHPGLSNAQPSDTIFYRMREGEFDVILSLYHDQALGPLKTLEFHSAVNVTLGLPFLRSSPDHGTGFEIAGKGKANTGSFSSAMKFQFQALKF